MKTYLTELEAFLASNQVVVERNTEKIRDGETVVGSCSDKVKKILAFIYKLKDDLDDRKACLEATNKDLDQIYYTRWEGEAYLIREKIKAAGMLMWITIHEENPKLLDMDHLGLREGWAIVSAPEKISLKDVVMDEIVKIILRENHNGEVHGNN